MMSSEPGTGRAPAAGDSSAAALSWEVHGDSVRGFSHLRSGLPNQDSIAHWSGDKAVILAISDGHGSGRCFRSDRGSRFAVDAAMEVLKELAEREGAPAEIIREISALTADGRIARSIVARWNARVRADLARDPIAAVADALAAPPPDQAAKQGAGSGPNGAPAGAAGSEPSVFLPRQAREPYGATLIAALMTDMFGLFLQLGDGDAMVLTCDRSVERAVEQDPENIANETKSLCGEKPISEFRTTFQVWAGRPPLMMLLSTDGYSNSFRDPQGFEKAVQDIHGVVTGENGELTLRRQLAAWLRRASEFSGDDVTLGLVWRNPPSEDGPSMTSDRAALDEDAPPNAANDTAATGVIPGPVTADPGSARRLQSDTGDAAANDPGLRRNSRIRRIGGWSLVAVATFSVALAVAWWKWGWPHRPPSPEPAKNTQPNASATTEGVAAEEPLKRNPPRRDGRDLRERP